MNGIAIVGVLSLLRRLLCECTTTESVLQLLLQTCHFQRRAARFIVATISLTDSTVVVGFLLEFSLANNSQLRICAASVAGAVGRSPKVSSL